MTREKQIVYYDINIVLDVLVYVYFKTNDVQI